MDKLGLVSKFVGQNEQSCVRNVLVATVVSFIASLLHVHLVSGNKRSCSVSYGTGCSARQAAQLQLQEDEH